MASESGGSTAVVALFAILLLAMLGAFIAWQAGVFSSGDSQKRVDVNITTDKK